DDGFLPRAVAVFHLRWSGGTVNRSVNVDMDALVILDVFNLDQRAGKLLTIKRAQHFVDCLAIQLVGEARASAHAEAHQPERHVDPHPAAPAVQLADVDMQRAPFPRRLVARGYGGRPGRW